MFQSNWRQSTWNSLQQDWDVLIIGGGITGAGVFRRAVTGGLKALLVEAQDFASSTSSKSSKLVHGGIRYLRSKQYEITFESVRQRERLLKEAPALVLPLGCVMPYSDQEGQKGMFRFGVTLYDLMAPKWQHRHLSLSELHQLAPKLNSPWVKGAYLYYDATVDDARLVFRLISETVSDGGSALNYTQATRLLRSQDGTVCGAVLKDLSSANLGETEVKAKVVINATGPQSDALRTQVHGSSRIRPLRGSHLVFKRNLLPLQTAITFVNKRDRRAMFAIPWESATVIGTTDLDHSLPLSREPFCTQEEIDYLLEAGNFVFPGQDLTQENVVSTYAGVRPIVHGDASNPSAESRRHVVMEEEGLITITGGKLTIFRIMAEDALQQALPRIGKPLRPIHSYFKPLLRLTAQPGLEPTQLNYLAGRYGHLAREMSRDVSSEDAERIDDLPSLWLELGHAARYEAIEHLDDLLLRRVRLGVFLPDGASAYMPAIRSRVQGVLGWDDTRWQSELSRYRQIYDRAYSKAPTGAE